MDFKALFTQLVISFNRLTRNQKLIITASFVGMIGFLVFLVLYTSKVNEDSGYKVLFESLSPSDAALIIEQLDKEQIPYRIPKDNVIEVPQEYVYKQRIAIASLGIPKDNSVGFELFDKQEFGATSFDQNIKYMRALEGELAKTISSLSPVKKASVGLAIPKESLFVSKQIEPTASIMIELEPNSKLNNKQVLGIKNLVAASVPKLKTENVTVVDSDGETLGGDDEMTQMSEASLMQDKYKTKEEKNREQKIVNVLAPFIGSKDRVVAKVSIDYDFSRTDLTSETYDPENVVRSEQSLEEKREGVAPEVIGGVPGAVSNIGPVEGLQSQEKSDKYEKTTATTNYEVSKKVSTTKGQFATIKRITAAVVVDGKYEEKLDENSKSTGEMQYVPLDDAQLAAITSLVEQSIGVDKARGDQVSVRNFQFEETAQGIFKPETFADGVFAVLNEYFTPFSELIKYLVVLIVLLIAYKKILSPFAEKMLEVTKEDEHYDAPHLDIEDDEDDDLAEKVSKMRKKVEDQLGFSGNYDEEELKHEVLLDKIRAVAEERTDEFAQILKNLLHEEQENVQETKERG
jgi:flagellar M-ring protein FliF